MLNQAQLNDIVYPVLTLPPEIISEIFRWCLPPSPQFVQPDPAAVPLTLLAICRQWRNRQHRAGDPPAMEQTENSARLVYRAQ
jgi:hypothetical protein